MIRDAQVYSPKIALFTVVLFAAWGCATTEEPKGPAEPQLMLKAGATIPHVSPLPDQTNIEVVWHHPDGRKVTYRGFRQWDFDKDGRVEMLEVFDEAGEVKAYVYDFDADGKVDKVSHRDFAEGEGS